MHDKVTKLAVIVNKNKTHIPTIKSQYETTRFEVIKIRSVSVEGMNVCLIWL